MIACSARNIALILWVGGSWPATAQSFDTKAKTRVLNSQTEAMLSRAAKLSSDYFLFDRHLTAEQKNADLAPELVDAILRVEGVFDPTRVGFFGPALRMSIRSGTASMINVFGDRWTRADADPNLHYRVRYMAQAWLHPPVGHCDDFERFRPDDIAIVFDRVTPAECARMSKGSAAPRSETQVLTISAAPTNLPVIAAPYPGSRFSPKDLRAVIDARLRTVRDLARCCGITR